MTPIRFWMAVIFCVISLHVQASTNEISRIAFGSCANQNIPQPVWDAVNKSKPDLFLLIGDNIYADTDDAGVMRAKYKKFAELRGFEELRSSTRLLGTWDDHDYGRNDVGVEFPHKKQSQEAFLDFFGVPNDSPRRQQEGIYHSEILGPEGKRVQIILLDTRYHRSAPLKSTNSQGKLIYVSNTDVNSTVLGAAQWKWLEQQLRKPAEVRLLVSSIQVVAEDHEFEKWMNFPHERSRLFRLIRDTRANGVVLLSGDRHLAELSMMDAGIGYPLYDLTASGLNQAAKKWRPLEVNQHRVATMNFDDHFGVVELFWKTSVINLTIRDVLGEVRIRQKLPLSLLQHPVVPR